MPQKNKNQLQNKITMMMNFYMFNVDALYNVYLETRE